MLIGRLQVADRYWRQAGAGGRQRAQVREMARAHFRGEQAWQYAHDVANVAGIKKGSKAGIEEVSKERSETSRKKGSGVGSEAGIEKSSKAGIEEGSLAGIEEANEEGIEEGS
jgi:hypothetical protein